MKEPQKAGSLSSTTEPQNHSKGGKGKERKKERGEEKKSNGCTLNFYNSYFGEFLAEKNCWTHKGLFGDNVIKNPARYV